MSKVGDYIHYYTKNYKKYGKLTGKVTGCYFYAYRKQDADYTRLLI